MLLLPQVPDDAWGLTRVQPREVKRIYYLEEDDIREALSYAAWRVEETEVPLGR